MRTAEDKILMTLKMRGEVTSAQLASEMDITKEGARLHLVKLEESGLVKKFARSRGVGRPAVYYSLSEKGVSRFPDSHAQVTVELLQSVKKLLGENALDLLISDREKQTITRYQQALKKADTVEDRLEALCQIRSEEGYMAEWKKDAGDYLLIENHCPICAAAMECQGFCRAELKNFRHLIGPGYQVNREQHIVAGAQRCVYRIK